jgi:hypothetical protein
MYVFSFLLLWRTTPIRKGGKFAEVSDNSSPRFLAICRSWLWENKNKKLVTNLDLANLKDYENNQTKTLFTFRLKIYVQCKLLQLNWYAFQVTPPYGFLNTKLLQQPRVSSISNFPFVSSNFSKCLLLIPSIRASCFKHTRSTGKGTKKLMPKVLCQGDYKFCVFHLLELTLCT